MMGIKGHNAFAPCRSCDIQGVLNPDAAGTTYYVPLHHPGDDPRPDVDLTAAWDPQDLPKRTHASFADRLAEINKYTLKKDQAYAAMLYGLSVESILATCPGINMVRSFPYEYMHIIFENTVPNLIRFWRGKFKELDAGQDYVIEEHVWEIIGKETAAAVKTIPASFVGHLPNIATDQGLYKAEYYSFWFTYLAPILLKGRFKAEKYYAHMCDLVRIIKMCLEFSISGMQLESLREDIVNWVLKYEE
jgi:hypothetical protein